MRPPAFTRWSACAFAGLVAGCGSGEQADRDRVEKVVKTYAKASSEGDAETACAQTAPEMFEDTTGTCEDFVAINSEGYGREAGRRQAAGDWTVKIQGDRAVAEGKNLGIYEAKRTSEGWKLIDVR